MKRYFKIAAFTLAIVFGLVAYVELTDGAFTSNAGIGNPVSAEAQLEKQIAELSRIQEKTWNSIEWHKLIGVQQESMGAPTTALNKRAEEIRKLENMLKNTVKRAEYLAKELSDLRQRNQKIAKMIQE